MNIKKSILIRIWIAYAVVVVLAVGVLITISRLQFYEKEKWVALSKEQSTMLREVEAARGNIYSEDGSLIATSVPRFDIRIDTRASGITDEVWDKELDSLCLIISQQFKDKTFAEWRRMLQKGRVKNDRYLLLKRNVSYDIAMAMEEWPIFRMGKYKGGFIREESHRREFPFGMLARRTIGFSRPDFKVGIEGAFDSLLKGISGKRLEQRLYGGVWKPIKDGNEFEPRNGLDIVTTIDINIQDVAEAALLRTLLNNEADHGCAIVMEVKTGQIKAIANLAQTAPGVYNEVYNHAIGEASDPGSTFKLVSALALIEDGFTSLEDSIDIEWGKTRFYDITMEDAHASPFKKRTFREVFEHSSNVGVAKEVYKYYKTQPEKFLSHIYKLGLDKPIGLELKGEGVPRIKKPGQKDWYATTLPWMAIGYETRITAMQMLAVYNAIANEGKMVKPYFVKEIKETGKVIESFGTQVLNPAICSPETLSKLKELLTGVVQNGTGEKLKGLDYSVAGKTGTAQIIHNASGYDKNSHKASFVGYFPADRPLYTCIVVVTAPKKGIYYGGSVAGPVFKEIADKIYSSQYQLHPELQQNQKSGMPYVKTGTKDDIKTVLNKLMISSHTQNYTGESEWVKVTRNENNLDLFEWKPTPQHVPDVRGMGLKSALYILENRGLKVMVTGYGVIREQSVVPGSIIKKGDTIWLRLSNG